MKYAYQKFHQKTKIIKFDILDQVNYPKNWIRVNYKAYPRFEETKLPQPRSTKIPLTEILNARQSTRNYKKKKINLKLISELLYYSVGLKDNQRRTYASAGGRYPCEIYIVTNNVLYHYNVKNHSLETMWKVEGRILRQAIAMEWADKAALTIFITGVFARTTIKYKDRGYLYVQQEVGAIWQNFYLVATSLGLGACAIGGFLDDKINNILDVDGEIESTLSTITIG